MGQKTVRFSDLSGDLITHEDSAARIVVRQHPELGDRPVEIEAHADEARAIEKAALQLAVVDLYLPGEAGPHQVAMDAAAFDELAATRPMSEVLLTASPARRVPATAGDRALYASAAHAGTPHRGRITEAEKQLVRDQFDEINERLTRQGYRTISLSDPGHVERYGLEELARSRGCSL